MRYTEEFAPDEHPPIEVVEWLQKNEFCDQSWHNDLSPCWSKGNVLVWATSEEAAEANEVSRYSLQRLDDDGNHISDTEDRCFSDWDSCRLEIESILEKGWLPV